MRRTIRANHLPRHLVPHRSGHLLLRLGVCAIAVSATGCVTNQLQKNLDTAIEIERRCTVVQETLPASNYKEPADAVLDSVMVRLLGTCTSSLTCVNSHTDPNGIDTDNHPIEKIKQDSEVLQDDLTKLHDALEALSNASKKDSKQTHQSLTDAVSAAKASLNEYRANLSDGEVQLRAIASNLSEARSDLETPCKQRSTCIAALTRSLASRQKDIEDELQKIHDDSLPPAALLNTTALPEQADALAATYATSLPPLAHNVMEAAKKTAKSSNQWTEDATALSNSAAYGVVVLQQIINDGEQAVASYFFAPQFNDVVADRVLGVLDSELQRTEHLIDQLDSKYYAAGSITVNVFASDIQHVLDHAYIRLTDTWFKDKAAQLALARAACTRLEAGHTGTSSQSTLFMPFLLAMFTNIQLENSKQYVLSQYGDEKNREKILDHLRERFTSPTDVDDQLHAAINREPPQPQQVAICTGIEIQKLKNGASTLRLATDTEPVHVNAQQQCAAKLANKELPNQLVTPPSAPSNPPKSSVAGLCTAITARGNDLRCSMTPMGAVIEFASYFKTDAHSSKALESDLSALGDILALHQAAGNIEVEGFASHAPVPCRTRSPHRANGTCGDDGNKKLSLDRAQWAANILRRRCPSITVKIKGNGAATSLDDDTALDRRLRVALPTELTVGSQ
ncbi:hypothetical protein KY49_3548 [Burkholderia sp. MSHR3999]|uniref:hypothetical protein n=1 Tax=Burkholderia sp. MSHR3999 TaxID=1542965 RepID=UPI0005B6E495|nr:hypothetical protein [Burkholderia sp. MSHR3999]KIP18195.1 hypothetical protein KY49_3548 [Burkholderia sp. MSHR3999]